MVTIKDISKKSGYSVTTVSKALNDYPDIPQKTKDKILKLCDEMGYVPNLSARSLVNKKSYTIGVIFEENTGLGLQHPLFSNILESFKNEVEKSGYDIMFLSKSMGHNKGSYYQHCLRKQVDGVLVVCAEYDSKEMHELYEGTIPTVIIDFVHGNALSITSNNELGVKQAVRYLKDLGHTKIAHIHGSKQTYIGDLRFSFFK